MKMKKLVLADYLVKKRVLDPEKNVVEEKNVPYNVRQSIGGILYHPDLQLTMKEAIARKPLADSIENCQEDFVYVTVEDFKKITDAFGKVKGYGKDDLELLERIEKTEEVETEISEKKE